MRVRIVSSIELDVDDLDEARRLRDIVERYETDNIAAVTAEFATVDLGIRDHLVELVVLG